MRKLWITLPLLFFGYVGNVEANDDEIHCLAENIYWEARSESTAGRVAVGSNTEGNTGKSDWELAGTHVLRRRG